jgi:hypothetical protein
MWLSPVLTIAAQAVPAPPRDLPPSPPEMKLAPLPPVPPAPDVPLPEGTAEITARSKLFLVPPRAAFPDAALRDELQGRCKVIFTVDGEGVPQGIRPYCSNDMFVPSVVAAVTFARLDMSGDIKPGDVLALPFAFLFEQ